MEPKRNNNNKNAKLSTVSLRTQKINKKTEYFTNKPIPH